MVRTYRKARIVISILIVLCFSRTVSSQQALTLSSAIELALKNNQQISIATNDRLAREKERSELSTTSLPQLKGGFSAIYAPSSTSFGYDPALSNGGQLGAQVFVQQSLYDGGARGLKSDQLSLDITGAGIALQSVKRDLRYNVTAAFIDILRFRDETILRQQGVDQLQEYLDLAKRRFHGGGASESDILRTEVDLSNATIALQQAKTSYNSARYSLSELLGGTIDTAFAIEGRLEDLIAFPQDTLSDFSLDLQQAHTAIERGTLDVQLTEHEAYPVFSLVADAGLLTSGDNLKLSSSDRSSMFGYSIGVVMEVPLLDWGGRTLRKEEKGLELQNLSSEMTLLHRRLGGELQRLRLQLRDARERYENLKTNAAKAKDVFLLTKSRYAVGNALAVEVLAAQQSITDSEVAALQTASEIDVISARMIQLTTQQEQ